MQSDKIKTTHSQLTQSYNYSDHNKLGRNYKYVKTISYSKETVKNQISQ